jgi:PQQ-like domain
MEILKKKTMTILIALILTLSIAIPLINLPTVDAAVTYTHQLAFVAASPLVVGVGQEMILVEWPSAIPPDIGEILGLVPGGRCAWYGVTMVVTKPDNSTETITIEKSDPVGGGYALYTPTQIGTYSVQSFFPEVWKNTTTTQAWYSAAASAIVQFTVQQDPVEMLWPETPLPTDYWTRPLNSANHDWYKLAGSWLGGAYQQPAGVAGGTTANLVDGMGPESAHILWTKTYYIGGLQDEMFDAIGYQTQHYQGIGFSGTILNGVLSYTPRDTAHGNTGWTEVDLYTGETLYSNYSETRPSMGQIYNYESGNQHGGYAYYWRTSGVVLPEIVRLAQVQYLGAGNNPLRITDNIEVNRTATPISVGTVWQMLDGYTGRTICYVANVSNAGTAVYGKDGSLTYYNLVNYGTTAAPSYYVTIWNSSTGTMIASQGNTGAWQWRPSGGSGSGASISYFGAISNNNLHNGAIMYSLNASIPSILAPRNSILNETATIRAVREAEYMIYGTAGRNDERGVVQGYLTAVSLVPGQEGKQLWTSTITPPFASYLANNTASMTGVFPEDGVVVYESARMLQRWGYDMKTGTLLWTGEPEVQMNYYGMSENYYEGKLLTFGYGGQIRTYNITTGEIMWTYNSTTIGLESAYGGNYPTGVAEICDGKLYLTNGEHSPTQPLMRGQNLRCIDATTGKEIWKILGYFGGMSPTSYNSLMADGIFVGLNYFDMQLYAIGKGPSGTTVSAPQVVPTLGSSVMITGTVTDQTATGRRTTNGNFQFTLKGTPAISDESMSAWMEYMFMQQTKPKDATGVPVSLTAIDPNGNLVPVGEVTSDINGVYGCKFTPEVPGTYQIIANFAGSKSYGSSSASTYLAVEDSAATPAPTATTQPVTLSETYFIPAIVGLFIFVAIIGAVIILTLRKRA